MEKAYTFLNLLALSDLPDNNKVVFSNKYSMEFLAKLENKTRTIKINWVSRSKKPSTKLLFVE
jgi:hypothetical protein